MKPEHKICEKCDPCEEYKKIFKMKRLYLRTNEPKDKWNYKRTFNPIGWFCWQCGNTEIDTDILAEIEIRKEEDTKFKNKIMNMNLHLSKKN